MTINQLQRELDKTLRAFDKAANNGQPFAVTMPLANKAQALQEQLDMAMLAK